MATRKKISTMRIALLALTTISLVKTANAMNPGQGNAASCNCYPTSAGGGVYCTQTNRCECYLTYDDDDYAYTCNHSPCCSGFNRDDPQVPILKERPGSARDNGDRHLEEEGPIHIFHEGDEAKYRDIVAQCGDYDYETALYADKHLYAIASPTSDAEAAKCPHIVIHAKFGSDGERPQKVAMVYGEKKHVDSRVTGNTHPMGTFKLSTLANAYEATEPGLDTGFDILNNNCATIMVNLARNLEIKIDTSVTSYVANRLLQEAGSGLLNKIRGNLGLHKRNLRADMNDHELINGLTEQYAAEIMA